MSLSTFQPGRSNVSFACRTSPHLELPGFTLYCVHYAMPIIFPHPRVGSFYYAHKWHFCPFRSIASKTTRLLSWYIELFPFIPEPYTLKDEVGFSSRQETFVSNRLARGSASAERLVEIRYTPPFCGRGGLSSKGGIWRVPINRATGVDLSATSLD